MNNGIKYPRAPPRIIVIAKIGINDFGSFHPIRIPEGSKTRNPIKTPLRIGWTSISIVAMKNPTITHIANADIFASHESFLMIIGITSIMPAAMPRRIPIITDFKKFKMPDGSEQLIVQGMYRIKILSYSQTDPYFEATVLPVQEVTYESVEVDALVNNMKMLFQKIVDL